MTKNEISENKVEEKLRFVLEHIRSNSALGKFTTRFDLLEAPIELEEREVDEIIQTLTSSEEYRDLKELNGKKSRYLYSNIEMTDNYAKMLFRIEEKDLLNLVAETVRYDSKKYPRTTNLSAFYAYPFNFSKDEFNNIMGQLNAKEEYKDIKKSSASNGAVHIYSDLYLTEKYANALTEWIEVSMDE